MGKQLTGRRFIFDSEENGRDGVAQLAEISSQVRHLSPGQQLCTRLSTSFEICSTLNIQHVDDIQVEYLKLLISHVASYFVSS